MSIDNNQTQPKNKYFGSEYQAQLNAEKAIIGRKYEIYQAEYREFSYNLNPKKCLNCNTNIPYKKSRENKFCSRSCSVSVANARTPKRTKQPKTKKIFYCQTCKIVTVIYPIRRCVSCTLNKSTKRSKEGNIKAAYRHHTLFNIDLKKHPELINPDLYVVGWYRAKNHINGYNPKGMTWEHLFRVSDGFKLGIDPKILSHPANAEMISWEENIKRRKSAISYEELLQRIIDWDLKYN